MLMPRRLIRRFVKQKVLLGGGQEAMSVTTTSLRQGKFEARFWHRIFEEEVGRVKGHFGPLNTYVRKAFLSRPLLMPAFPSLPPPPSLTGSGSPCIRRAPHMRPEAR